MTAPRPLVPTTIRTEFGDILEDSSFHNPMGANRDYTYVPGYSGLRVERDQKIAASAKEHGGQVRWAEIPTLPVRLQWVRIARVISGQPDNTKEIAAGSDGYRFAKLEDVGQTWMTELPAGATVTADGAIRKGDTALMVCDAKQAARNAAINQMAIQRQTKNAAAPLLAQTAAEPWIESTPAPQIAAPKSRIKSS